MRLDEDKANEWRDFVINCFDDRDTFDREYFKENIMNWFQDFQDAHKDIDGYNDELESDYEWSWDDFFDTIRKFSNFVSSLSGPGRTI